MRDEQVSELFDSWEEMPATAREIGLYEQERNRQAAFEAGFRAAERMAKIDVLEKLSNYATSYGDYQTAGTIEAMLSELKAGQ